ncbi:MAG: ATP-binding protein [Bryobacterales bacterium]|nr:ATP-binding protein [Bryobacterales bacterium]
MPFPFSAIMGQERMKRALIFNAVDLSIGGALISGTRGTAKSTVARALAGLLPPIDVAKGDPFHREPSGDDTVAQVPTPFVNLPLGSTEDRLLGTLDIQRALQHGEKRFEPGLLAAAHRGVLYVDEVNLLPDHLVDVLLDAVAMGVNRIEREGVSFEHPARVILVGTMNPEEGELRPQLLDRFGLFVQADGHLDPAERKEVVRRRLRFDDAPDGFMAEWASPDKELATRIVRARETLLRVSTPEERFDQIADLAAEARVEGLRADIVMAKAARAAAAFEGADEVTAAHVEEAAELALGHRRRSQAEASPPPPPPAPSPKPHKPPAPPTERTGEPRDQGVSSGRSAHSRESHFTVGSPLETHLPSPPTRRLGAQPGSPQGRRDGPLACRLSGAFVRAVEPRPGDSLSIAPAATLRAAALEGAPLAMRHLRVKQRRSRRRNLLLFAVDASGSMAASERMRAAKGAVCGLLEEAYQKRDLVGLVAFRGERAEELLVPTRSAVRAYRRLSKLPTGGRTPLAAGLAKALQIVARCQRQEAELTPYLVVVTDGRATWPSGTAWADVLEQAAHIARNKIAALCIDTESGPVRFGQTTALARAMDATCRHISSLPSREWSHVIREWVELSGGDR